MILYFIYFVIGLGLSIPLSKVIYNKLKKEYHKTLESNEKTKQLLTGANEEYNQQIQQYYYTAFKR